MMRIKTENRKPKSEGNPKAEIRRPSSHRVWALALHSILGPQALRCRAEHALNDGPDASFGFGLRISVFGFPSDFGFRISDFEFQVPFGFRFSASIRPSAFGIFA